MRAPTLTLAMATAFLALAATDAARAEVKDVSSGGFTIENSEVVPVDAMTAWTALVDDVGRWWPSAHTWWGDASKLSIQPRAGGCFCEIDGQRQAAHMTVSFVDPGKTLRMTGGLGPLQGMGFHGALEWRFVAVEGGTRITLYYRAGGYSPDDIGKFVPVIDQVQGVQLGGLADYLRDPARRHSMRQPRPGVTAVAGQASATEARADRSPSGGRSSGAVLAANRKGVAGAE